MTRRPIRAAVETTMTTMLLFAWIIAGVAIAWLIGKAAELR